MKIILNLRKLIVKLFMSPEKYARLISVNIGDGALIAADSVVTKPVPSGVVVGGNPVRILSRVDNYIKQRKV